MSNKARAGERIDALTRHNRPIRSEVDILSRAFAPRQNPHDAPPLTISEDPAVCLIVNMSWVSHVIGVLETLNQPDAWNGDADEKHRAQNEIQLLIEMLMTGDACMVDPCCPETNEILTDIKVLNQTIVTNMVTIINQNTTIIDNDTTIINQNDNLIYQQLINQYQTFNTTNTNISLFNQMIYDGDHHSIAPNLGDDWASGDNGDGILCAAINRYIDHMLYLKAVEVNQDMAALGIVVGGLAAIIIGGLTLGVGAAAGAGLVAGAFGLGLQAWNEALQDNEAQRKVACCMFDGLSSGAISQASFKAAVADCGFTEGNEVPISAAIHEYSQTDENYLAFLRILGETSAGNAADCECGCEEGEFTLMAVNDCIVTPVEGEPTKWRIQQSNYIVEGVDPHRIFKSMFRDEFNRCFNIIGGVGTATSAWALTNCAGVDSSGTGGLGGEMVLGTIYNREQITTPFVGTDIVIELECPS